MSINNRFSGQEARNIVSSNQRLDEAYIQRGQNLAPSTIRVLTLNLDEAPVNPKLIGFPFKACYVYEASDSGVVVELRPFSDSENNNYVPLRSKDVLNFDNPVNKCFLNWQAQVGKIITLVFFTDASFNSGSSINEFKTGVDGNSFSTLSPITVTSTITEIFPQDLLAGNYTLYVESGTVYIGGLGVTPSNGIPYSGGERISNIKNTGTLYGICSSGTSIIRILKES